MADVGCAGILVADSFCGPLDALPEPGELIALDDIPAKAGGCAANVALGLAKQGVAVDIAGCVGRDAAANVVLDALESANVHCEQVQRVDVPTSQTVVLLVRGQDRRYLHVFGANRCVTVEHFRRDWLASLKVFYLGGLYVLPGIDLGALAEAFAFCRDNGVKTVLDVVIPKQTRAFGALDRVLQHTDLFLPNDDEAHLMTGLNDPRAQAEAFLAHGAGAVVITRGEHGALAASDGRVWSAGVFPVESVDMTGSGDAFTAGMITALLRGADMPQMLRYASALGASSTLAVGTTDGVFTREQADAFLQTHLLEVVEVT